MMDTVYLDILSRSGDQFDSFLPIIPLQIHQNYRQAFGKVDSDRLSLKELCGKKLLSDVSLLFGKQLPTQINNFLMYMAVNEGRILSVAHLLKHMQTEEFTLPLPESFKEWNHFKICQEQKLTSQTLRKFTASAQVVCKTFMNVIADGHPNSKVRIIDLNALPMGPSMVREVCNFIISRKSVHEGRCSVLKMGCIITSQTELALLNQTLGRKSDLKLVLTGLHFYNNEFTVNDICDLLDLIGSEDLRSFSTAFSVIHGFHLLYSHLRKFNYLSSFHISYLTRPLMENSWNSISETIHELRHLSHFSLRGSFNTLHLQTIFQQFCTANKKAKMQKTETGRACCTAHRGALHYLDISDCKLSSLDISYLKDSQLSKTLKHLVVNNLLIELESLTQLLPCLSSSLVVLEICSLPFKDYQLGPILEAFSGMSQLKYLNISGLVVERSFLPNMASTLCTMQNLEWLTLSFPRDCSEKALCEEAFKKYSRPAKISWVPVPEFVF